MRIGTTSWIIEAGLVENARYLSGIVDDMEMVLFDLPDGRTNFPSAAELRALHEISEETGLSYTVHLPLDLHMSGDKKTEHHSLSQARRVIGLTENLKPLAWIAHLDGEGRRTDETEWFGQAAHALRCITRHLPDPSRLAIENVEGAPPGIIDQVLDTIPELPISRCVDVGHLWLDGHDPLPWLEKALHRLRVVHIHGVAFDQQRGRVCDHVSLAAAESLRTQAVMSFLKSQCWDGVLSIEVFSRRDFAESLAAICRTSDFPAERLQ